MSSSSRVNDLVKRLSWDDLRIVKAIGLRKNIAAGANLLGVDNSTAFRRLARIEEIFGAMLFERRRTGYEPTLLGQQIIELAERLEDDILSVVRQVPGFSSEARGRLRITASDTFAFHFFAPIFAEFRKLHPSIHVEVDVGNDALNLARGESDIAIRATNAPPENLVGSRIASIAWAPYGLRGFQDLVADLEELSEIPWVAYSGALAALPANKKVEATIPSCNIIYTINSVEGAAKAIAAGIGVGYLPCLVGDNIPTLTRIGPVNPDLSDSLWLLTHPDVRRSGRVQHFFEFCIRAMRKLRPAIEATADYEEPAKEQSAA